MEKGTRRKEAQKQEEKENQTKGNMNIYKHKKGKPIITDRYSFPKIVTSQYKK